MMVGMLMAADSAKVDKSKPWESRAGLCLMEACRRENPSITMNAYWKEMAPGTELNTLAQLGQCAERLGFHVCVTRLSPSQIARLERPVIFCDETLTGEKETSESHPFVLVSQWRQGTKKRLVMYAPPRRSSYIDVPKKLFFSRRIAALIISREKISWWFYLPWWMRAWEIMIPSVAVVGFFGIRWIRRWKTSGRSMRIQFSRKLAARVAWATLLVLGVGGAVWMLTRPVDKDALNGRLIQAAGKGDVDQVKLLLRKGADPGAMAVGNGKLAGGGLAPIHLAAYGGHKPVVDLLIAQHVDINTRDSAGAFTPLEYAIVSGHKEIVELLIGKGADVNAKGTRGTILYSEPFKFDNLLNSTQVWSGDDRLGGFTPLQHAVASHHPEIAELLIAKGADVNVRDKRTGPILFSALMNRDKDLAMLLIAKGADVNAKDSRGATPLHWAMWVGEKEIAELLIAKGADVNATDGSNTTPLTWASQRGLGEIGALLVAHGASVDIFAAAGLGDTERVEMLLNQDPKLATARDKSGLTPLIMAAKSGAVETVKLLLARGAEVNDKGVSGWTPLHAATKSGKKEIVELLLAKGANVHAGVGREVSTPLHWAAMLSKVDLVDLFLSKGAGLESKDANGRTPLLVAAESGDREMMLLLLSKGADLQAKDSDGSSALHWAMNNEHQDVRDLLASKGGSLDIFEASALGDVGQVTRQLKENPGLVHATSKLPVEEGGWSIQATPLQWAASQNQKAVAELLLANGADINVIGDSGMTPLHLAAAKGHMEMTRFLLEKKANVNIQSSQYWTPLGRSLEFKNKEMSELLKKYGAKEEYEEVPLISAVDNGDEDAVSRLLSKGADINARSNAMDCWGMTALMMAAKNGDSDTATILLEKGADVKAKDAKGRTALMAAMERDSVEVVNMLIAKGSDVNAEDMDGSTALYMAACHAHPETMEVLKAAGAHPPTSLLYAVALEDIEVSRKLIVDGADVNMKDKEGNTPLIVATRNGRLEIARMLLSKGADANAKDHRQQSPLTIAAQSGQDKIVELLLRKGVDINGGDPNSFSPLMMAVTYNKVEAVKLLLAKGADVKMGRAGGWTPLMLAAQGRSIEIVGALIAQGADVNSSNQQGHTALSLASAYNKVDVVKLLIDKGADVNVKAEGGLTVLQMAVQKKQTQVVELLKAAGAKE